MGELAHRQTLLDPCRSMEQDEVRDMSAAKKKAALIATGDSL
jgi:hypothetical protein